MDNRVLVVVPTYNERENIGLLVEQVGAINPQFCMLVVDDNSKDGTVQEVVKLQSKYRNLYTIIRNTREGLGSACREGLLYAIKEGFDAVVLMDADLSHAPSDIPKMLELLQSYDLVIGSRYVAGGGFVDVPFIRVVNSRVSNAIARGLLRLPVNDITSGFRAMKRNFLERIDLTTFGYEGYSFYIELTLRAFAQGFKIGEFPIQFRRRHSGRSKISLKILVDTLFRVLFLSRNNKRRVPVQQP